MKPVLALVRAELGDDAAAQLQQALAQQDIETIEVEQPEPTAAPPAPTHGAGGDGTLN